MNISHHHLTTEKHNMAAESAGGIALLKLYGIKAAIGMIGAAMLYVVLPPVNADGSFNKREFVARLACAGIFSVIFGNPVYNFICSSVPSIAPVITTSMIDLMVGAPAWWISRAFALWFQKRSGKDIQQLLNDARDRA